MLRILKKFPTRLIHFVVNISQKSKCLQLTFESVETAKRQKWTKYKLERRKTYACFTLKRTH